MIYQWETSPDERVNARCAELRADKAARKAEVAQARTPVDPDTFRWSEIATLVACISAAMIIGTLVAYGFLYWAAGHIG